MMRRRYLLAAAPLALAGCAGGSPSFNAATIAQDVQIIASGLSRSLTQLSALNLPGLTPALLDICQGALVSLQAVARDIAGASTVADAQPLVIRVETYVNSFVGALSILPLPPEIKTALVAATILLPIVEAAVNLAVPPKAIPATMTPAQARDALK